jgi:hypothetical protein
MSFRSCCVAVIALGVLLPGGWDKSAGAAEEYKIQFVRPYKVGDEYKTQTTVFIKRGVGGNNVAFTGELHGAVKVLAVNQKNGGVTKLQCTPDKLTRDGKNVFPAGVVIVAEKANQVEAMTINGRSATPAEVELLRPMLGLSDPLVTISDDQAMGTGQPQAVGVAWPVNKPLMARQLAESSMAAVPASVKGESKILRITPAGGADAMLVRSAVTCDLMPHKNPGKVPILRGNVSINQEILLPVDTSKPPISATGEMRLSEVELTRHGQATISVDIQLTRSDQPKK